MAKSVKKAVSLPQETYLIAESLRKKLGTSRSQFVAEAIRFYCAAREQADLDSRYEAGYRRIPEDIQEVEALARASLSSFGKKETW